MLRSLRSRGYLTLTVVPVSSNTELVIQLWEHRAGYTVVGTERRRRRRRRRRRIYSCRNRDNIWLWEHRVAGNIELNKQLWPHRGGCTAVLSNLELLKG